MQGVLLVIQQEKVAVEHQDLVLFLLHTQELIQILDLLL